MRKSFNSTLVQLKDISKTLLHCVLNSFNSTLVQLKEDLDRVFCVRLLSFNSTLVQLKGEKFLSDLRVAGLFQFYLSSIKSCWFCLTGWGRFQVSILP